MSSSADSMRSILRIARSIKAMLPVTGSPFQAADTIPPTVSLPQPPTIRAKLLQLGCSPSVADAGSRIYSLKSAELRAATEQQLQRVCSDLAKRPRHPALQPLSELLESVVSVFTGKYVKDLQSLEQRALDTVRQKLLLLHEKQPIQEKKTFNRDFIPFLEKYFEYDPFPSAADRRVMAEKSNMTSRQIEVWFQNHRRRARDEGHPVKRTRRSVDRAPPYLDLKSMEDAMLTTWIIPAHLRQVVDTDDEDDDGLDVDDDDDEDEFEAMEPEIIDLTDALEPPAPAHAFPTTFSQSRTMPSIILPITQFHFPAPQWRRTPSAELAAPREAISIDELIQLFKSQLHTRDSTPTASPIFQVPFTFIPPSAPLPYLLNRKVSVAPVQPTTALNTTTVRRSRGTKGANASKQLAAAAPSAAPRTKKPAGLPRRTPKRAPRRNPSPALSESSSPPSRTPSLDASDFSRFASYGTSSSRSSSGSSGPTTPIDSPVSLPFVEDVDPLFGDPVSISAFGRYATKPSNFALPIPTPMLR